MIVHQEVTRLLRLVFGSNVFYDSSERDFKGISSAGGMGAIYFRIESEVVWSCDVALVKGIIFRELTSDKVDHVLTKKFGEVKHNFMLGEHNIDNVKGLEFIEYHIIVDLTQAEYPADEINTIIVDVNDKLDTLEVSDNDDE